MADQELDVRPTAPAWKLQMSERDLDSNIIGLSPGSTIDAHGGPDLDVLIHVLGGCGWPGTARRSPSLPS